MERAARTPPPISGGTLLLMDDGRTAVASDPDLDLVHVVDLEGKRVLHSIELPEGDEPGRVVADDRGIVHVVARRGGAVLDIDPERGRVLERRMVCANPRGIAFEAERGALHVACAGGDLVTLPVGGGAPSRRVWLGPDLRDVLLVDGRLAVTRFRSAHLLWLDRDGKVIETEAPPTLFKADEFDGRSHHLRPNSAWRTIATPTGKWLMAHQMSTTKVVDDMQGGGSEDGGGGGGGYGGGPFDPPCGAVVDSVITLGDEGFAIRSSGLLDETVLPVDVAVSTTGAWVAVAVAGRQDNELSDPGVLRLATSSFTDDTDPGCTEPHPVPVVPGQYVAVAFDPEGYIVAQSREPAQIVRVNPEYGEIQDVISLPGQSRLDTGHELFHRDAGQAIACASCHPEGGDDGRVWRLAPAMLRHTPALAVGLRGTEPFHWVGDLPDMSALVDEVHVHRMGGHPLSDERVEALQSWMFSIPPLRPRRSSSDAAARRGAASFVAWGCGDCHRGASLDGGPDNVDLGLGLPLQVPPLRGVALHPPYMHDGRAADLREAVLDMLVLTRPGLDPSDDALDDVIAYLESL
ncbi:MAG: c-type cytochrome [Myxococcales bacterium]|nr:c-type cytochrome [Myxococcales bacterium]MCB9712917.1 c-type cytochrome [Myxococcales bacterium]